MKEEILWTLKYLKTKDSQLNFPQKNSLTKKWAKLKKNWLKIMVIIKKMKSFKQNQLFRKIYSIHNFNFLNNKKIIQQSLKDPFLVKPILLNNLLEIIFLKKLIQFLRIKIKNCLITHNKLFFNNKKIKNNFFNAILNIC